MVEATIVAGQLVLGLSQDAAPEADDDPDPSPDTPWARAMLAAGRTCLAQAQQCYRTGTRVDDKQAALLTLLLDAPPVREFAARHTTAAPWEIDMWVDLVRRAEPDFTAGPAIMLTLSALQAGDGTLAALAAQRALQADPVDRLAVLLAEAVAVGVDPASVTALLAG
jgi:hypothetical protein